MTFREWMMQQDWENKDLDKDLLLPGNKVYGPDTCVFVDKATNYFLTDSKAIRGEYPIGVTKGHKDKYYAYIKENGERKHLGTFDSPEEAHEAWYSRKRELAIALSLTQTDRRVADALLLRFPLKTQPQNFTASLL
ncbi:hypothetical protein vBPpSSYP_220 [Pseudomonas phage vB_PpS_SYP]|nr:hypothetical protein vBPpSSYP_220 [Pseudomonas phage vB_PpS_SYP]